MSITLYSFKLKREVPLLTDDEYRPIGEALSHRIKEIKEYRQKNGVSLEEARANSSDRALDLYEGLTGVRLAHPDELYWVQLSGYGRPCPQCSRPFRTPLAKFCAECGFELPPGEMAGPAVSP
jgi:DNA repair exonuclease SbcCD ATPase subunit